MMTSRMLLFIEPRQPASATPLIDPITRKMCAAFRRARASDGVCCGFHSCVCGATSSDRNYDLPNGDVTNSLCVHYVAYHRSEVPPEEVARIKTFTFGSIKSTLRELAKPVDSPPEQTIDIEQCPSDLRQTLMELEKQVAALTQQKDAAAADLDFVKAVAFRDQADKLKRRQFNIFREWQKATKYEKY